MHNLYIHRSIIMHNRYISLSSLFLSLPPPPLALSFSFPLSAGWASGRGVWCGFENVGPFHLNTWGHEQGHTRGHTSQSTWMRFWKRWPLSYEQHITKHIGPRTRTHIRSRTRTHRRSRTRTHIRPHMPDGFTLGLETLAFSSRRTLHSRTSLRNFFQEFHSRSTSVDG